MTKKFFLLISLLVTVGFITSYLFAGVEPDIPAQRTEQKLDPNPKQTVSRALPKPAEPLSSTKDKTEEPLPRNYPSEVEEEYLSARELAAAERFRETSERLHGILLKRPELTDRVLTDQAFRKYREHDDFRKLLNLLGRDVYQDLGLGPIQIPK